MDKKSSEIVQKVSFISQNNVEVTLCFNASSKKYWINIEDQESLINIVLDSKKDLIQKIGEVFQIIKNWE